MKLRELTTKNKTLVLAGKDEKSNESLISQVSPDEIVLHTEKPGSPFVNIKGSPNAEDIKEAAIFCASKSQDWRDNKSDVVVHKFLGKDIYKRKGMKTGTFGVKKHTKIKVKKKDIQIFIKNN